jgi:hypothetical protein
MACNRDIFTLLIIIIFIISFTNWNACSRSFQLFVLIIFFLMFITSMLVLFYLLISIVEGGVQLGPLDTATTNRPIKLKLVGWIFWYCGNILASLYQPRMIGDGDCGDNWWNEDWQGETEVLGENLPQRRFFHQKSHMPRSVLNPGRRGGKPATNRLSYGAD